MRWRVCAARHDLILASVHLGRVLRLSPHLRWLMRCSLCFVGLLSFDDPVKLIYMALKELQLLLRSF